MLFAPPRRRARADSIVPMINVVFLLLIFFLMTARIAPTAPFPVTPPEAQATGAAAGADILHVAADGTPAYGAATGADALAALADRTAPGPLLIRADAGLPMAQFAALLAELAALGVDDPRLVTVAP
ncbi:MAG: outer membrane transport energization protein ExbD [Rhodobacteraceae bacterium HLUCCA08]|nr:MAG: outer membrane transport energization protein ExbD [Rhodobacteraceae bacterium HLUCCA08]